MSAVEEPEVLPVFPLTGVVLLPGNWLPLHVFEPRYRAMIEDAMAGGRLIGMIQPRTAADDDAGPDPAEVLPPDPDLYEVGCAGRIERCEKLPDGRFLILLRGLNRFRVREELEPVKGYRRVAATWEEFAADAAEIDAEVELDVAPVVAAVAEYGRQQGAEIDLAQLAELPPRALVNGLSSAMPFAPAEKQALLEAPDSPRRRDLLLALLEMALRGGLPEDPLDDAPVN